MNFRTPVTRARQSWLARFLRLAMPTGLLVLLAPSLSHSEDEDALAPLIGVLLLFEDRAPAKALGSGYNHNCVLLEDGKIACWGYNAWGQLGDGTETGSHYPKNVSGISSGTAIGAGVRHSCAVLDNGEAMCWGGNEYGQLGNNTSGNKYHVPVSVNGISTAATISAGDEFSCATLANGSVKCWGRGSDGQLGNSDTENSDEPESVNLLNYSADVVDAGGYHACMVDGYGIAVIARCWGRNSSGQLGKGDYASPVSTPQTVQLLHSGDLTGVITIATGGFHSCVATLVGYVACWGLNGSGQVGLSPGGTVSTASEVTTFGGGGEPDAIAVATGANHSCALTDEGKVWCWGDNTYGQLGRGTSVVADHVPVAVSGIDTATAIGAGEFHSCALLEDHSVRCWGRNNHMQLGVNGISMSKVPVSVTGLTAK